MSTTRKLVPRASGEYRDGSPWTRNFRESIAALKASATKVSGTLTVTPSRITACQNAHIRFNASTTMSVAENWYDEVIFIFDFDDEGSVFDRMLPDSYMDMLGKSAELGIGYYGTHVWESIGSKVVNCFAYHTATNTWDEVDTVVTVVDPLSVHPESMRYIVAADGDFTGAPAGDHQYTDHMSALNAMATADAGGLMLLKRGTTETISGINVGPNIREAGKEWHIDAWGVGTRPKVICDFGSNPYGIFTSLFVLLEMESFTLANIVYTGLYNSSVDPQTVEGEVVAGGGVGGTGLSTDVQLVYGGFGSSNASPVLTNNVTIYGCDIRRMGKAFYSAGGNNHAIVNCSVSEWADYGVFHTYSVNFTMLGVQARVRDDCVHLGGGKDYTAIPRQVLHGPHRSARCIGTQIQQNNTATKNGWFSVTSCQPSIRLATDGDLYPSDPISLLCSRNLCDGGDGPLFFTPANTSIQAKLTDNAVIESNIMLAKAFTYNGTNISQACSVRNNISIQLDVPRLSPNDAWNGIGFTMYGADTNGTDPTVFDQFAKAYSNTIINNLADQSASIPWVSYNNYVDDVVNRATPAYPAASITANLAYAPNLAVTTENQVDPLFTADYVPTEPTFVDSETRENGGILDIFGNIRPSSCNAGAAQGGHAS